ncbi:AbrB/MazE/SpoVT family DNA-binding domain-containing protein [Rhodoferax sp.]|uniref:antitoxin n=1 Tax=Rhodoferax sp. TaxID=50421 RepID=UPI002623A865|nr:AbrB/MazE/SpoVT family DNA-binding domain-containing protein [Rhodoferax sp.]MDD2809697.1 AbrB/MazE/SpoVT family DNA-binding domain-containing protein [Rhodoferax sp.]MDD4944877.1 AbrB/MazE/SpoVT family DNA-binding domain-containing protein [Rhodoferax sp.]
MQVEAKLFKSGNSQAVRLPKAFRMPGDTVWIDRDAATGNIILKAKDDDQRQRNLEELFQLIREQPFTEDFIPPRDDECRPSPFEDWDAEEPIEATPPAKVTKAPKRARKAAA